MKFLVLNYVCIRIKMGKLLCNRISQDRQYYLTFSEEKNIKYQFQLVADNAYGFEENGVWNGMIGEIMRGVRFFMANDNIRKK